MLCFLYGSELCKHQYMVLSSTQSREMFEFLHEECILVYHFSRLFFFFTITLSLNDNKTYLIKDHCIKWEKSNVIIYTSWLWVIICRNQSSFSFSLYSKELGEWNAFSFLFKNNFLDFTYLRNKTCEYVWSS